MFAKAVRPFYPLIHNCTNWLRPTLLVDVYRDLVQSGASAVGVLAR